MMEALACGKPLSARARQVARSREELLGLLADFPGGDSDSDGELSFSYLVEAKESSSHAATRQPPAQKDHGSSLSSEQQQHQAAAAAARERRLRRRPSDSRGSCGGGGDGVLLNVYVPGLLTRSITAPRPCRGTLPAEVGQGTTATIAAGKARIEAPLAVGCWPALWGRGHDRRSKPANSAAGRRGARVPA